LMRVVYGFVAALMLVGLFTVGSGVRRIYLDYQDFKAIRAWAVEMNKLQQQQLKAKPQQEPAK
jgi:hypothetical protein